MIKVGDRVKVRLGYDPTRVPGVVTGIGPEYSVLGGDIITPISVRTDDGEVVHVQTLYDVTPIEE